MEGRRDGEAVGKYGGYFGGDGGNGKMLVMVGGASGREHEEDAGIVVDAGPAPRSHGSVR